MLRGYCRADVTIRNEASRERASGVLVIAAARLAKAYPWPAMRMARLRLAAEVFARGKSMLVTTG
jgi:hypothetical protein